MFHFCYLILLYLHYCDSARILVVVPTSSHSHQIVFRPFIKELANRGHNVSVFCVDSTKREEIPYVEEINIYYKYQGKYIKSITTDTAGKKNQRKRIIEFVYKIFEQYMLLSDEFQKIITKSYDIVIAEAFVEPGIIFSDLFKVPVITMSTFSQDAKDYELFAAPFDSFIYQSFVHEKSYNLTMFDKISMIFKDVEDKTIFSELNSKFDEFVNRKTSVQVASIAKIKNDISALFWFTHPVWEFLPVPRNVISIWGLNKLPKKELSEDLKSFLDKSMNGVIYISFGSIIRPSLLPLEKTRMLIRVFSELPYDILWKWDTDELPGQTTNIKISKWVPQSAVLGHHNIKVFVTHGGLQSTQEAIDAGVPLIGIPLYGDQYYNTEKFVYHKIGLQLQINHLQDEELLKAIDTVVKDDSYRQNVRRLGSLLLDQPQSPLQRVVWWTEHILRHPDVVHLRASASNISWTEYHQIDLISIIFFIVLSTFILLFLVIRFVWLSILFRV